MNEPSAHLFALVATLSAGLFTGAAVYINLVEHPARMRCGSALALKEFAPSYRRAAVMQAALAAVGFLSASAAWWVGLSASWLAAGVLLGSVIPFTLIVIFPTNKRLLDPSLDGGSQAAADLLRRWRGYMPSKRYEPCGVRCDAPRALTIDAYRGRRRRGRGHDARRVVWARGAAPVTRVPGGSA